jgi:predicted TPR repeat methyltransferase
MAENKKWIQGAIKRPGAFTKKAEKAGMSVKEYASKVSANPDEYDTRTVRQANLAKTLTKLRKKKEK